MICTVVKRDLFICFPEVLPDVYWHGCFPFSFLTFWAIFSFFPLLIPSIFDHTSTLVLFPHCILSSPSFLSPVPRVVAVSPQMRLVEDNPSSLSLVEIYKQRCTKKGIEHDNPVSRYYDRLATVQARGTQASHQVGGHMVMPYCVIIQQY